MPLSLCPSRRGLASSVGLCLSVCPGCCPSSSLAPHPHPLPKQANTCSTGKMLGLYIPPVLCSYSAVLEHLAYLPTSPKITPGCGFLYAVFAYPELKIMPNFVNTLCCRGCKFIVYMVSCMIFNLWQLGLFSSEVFITHYYVLFVLP